MTHNVQTPVQTSMNPVALSSYAVAVSSFAAAVLGLPISHWPSGALAGVGAFYLIVGFFSRTASIATHRDPHEISRHGSGADNLVAEAVGTARETSVPAIRSPGLAGAQR